MSIRSRVQRWARRAVLAWLGTTVATLLALLAIDYRRKRHRIPPTFPRIGPQQVVTDGEDVTIYTYGQDAYDDMLADIAAAEQHIFFETYIWKNDEIGQAFKQALTAAAERGVEVYLAYDVLANLPVPQSFYRFSDQLNVVRHPIITRTIGLPSARTLGRNHNKLLAVDEKVAYLGGYNVGATYATDWRDTHARLTGPVVRDLVDIYADYWNSMRRPGQPTLPGVQRRGWRNPVRVHRNVPGALHYPIRGMYLEAIDRASDYAFLTHAYLIPDDDLVRTLIEAVRRGVDVRIIVPAESNHIVADWISRSYYGALLRGGVRLFLFQGAMVHAKTATIDGEWSTIGTANLDRLSLSWNYEINVEITDADVAATMERIFAVDQGNSREITWSEWTRRHLMLKVSETVLRPLRPLM